MQAVIDHLPTATRYCTDGLAVYQDLVWPEHSTHVVSVGKRDTHTIESVNANLRTYLKRLARRTRCFSRCMEALRRSIRLFVWHYNRRQRVLLTRPQYRTTLPLLF